MKNVVISIVFTLLLSVLKAQMGGSNSFPLLDLQFNARNLALAGNYISAKDDDLNVALVHPALLNQQMHQAISVSQAIHPGKVSYGAIAYGHSLSQQHIFSASIRYFSYGTMKRTDKYGTELGSFSPLEYIVGVGYGYQQNARISVGINWNFIGSHLETYNSFGTSLDLGGVYSGESERFTVSALFKNVGVQFNAHNNMRAPLPANFLIAISQRLEHAPFRFSLLIHHLNKWDVSYFDPNVPPSTDILSGKLIIEEPAKWYEIIAQHLIGQVEIATKRIHLRAGFDYHARQTMRLKNQAGISGFSFGLGLHLKRIAIDYGFFAVSKAGTRHLITLSTSLQKMKK